MNNKFANDEKETYGIFVLLLGMMFGLTFLLAVINITFDLVTGSILLKIIFIVTSVLLFTIALVIKKKKRIYWISTYSYKDALKLSEEERDRISTRFFYVIGSTAILTIGYMIVGLILDTNVIVDIIVFVIIVLLGATSSIFIKE